MHPIISVILRSFLIDFSHDRLHFSACFGCGMFLYSYTELLWILDQWCVSYEVFHSDWWKHATFLAPCELLLPLNTLEQFSLSSCSFLICMCQSVLCWIVCRSLLCALSSTLSCELKLLWLPQSSSFISSCQGDFTWDYPPWVVAWKFFLDNKLGQL